MIHATDITFVKQGWTLLESLGEPIDNMLDILEIDLSELEIEEHTWGRSIITFLGVHREYNSIYLLNLLLKHNVEGCWNITTLHLDLVDSPLDSDMSDFECFLKLSRNIQQVYGHFFSQSLVDKLPSLFPNVQALSFGGEFTHLIWQDNAFSNLQSLQIEECYELRTVDLGNNLRNIEELWVVENELLDFSFLQQNMPHIRSLSLCASKKFHDLSLITHLTTLHDIGVDDTSINTLEPLQGFPELKYLNLIWCYEVTDYTPLLSGFPKLETIWISQSIMTATADEEPDLYPHLQVLRQLEAQRPNIQITE